jgi:hypothetical protein
MVMATDLLTFRGEVARLAYEARRLRQHAPPELKDDDALDRRLGVLEDGLAALAHEHVSANGAEVAGAPPEPPDYVKQYRREAKAYEDPFFDPDVGMQWIARESREVRERVERTLADLSRRIEDVEARCPRSTAGSRSSRMRSPAWRLSAGRRTAPCRRDRGRRSGSSASWTEPSSMFERSNRTSPTSPPSCAHWRARPRS